MLVAASPWSPTYGQRCIVFEGLKDGSAEKLWLQLSVFLGGPLFEVFTAAKTHPTYRNIHLYKLRHTNCAVLVFGGKSSARSFKVVSAVLSAVKGRSVSYCGRWSCGFRTGGPSSCWVKAKCPHRPNRTCFYRKSTNFRNFEAPNSCGSDALDASRASLPRCCLWH